jgi:GNAT superfamily N-acetyltransferase
MTAPDTVIRPARPADGPAYVDLVRGLASYERLPPPDDAAAARLLEHAFGPRPRYELLVAELGGAVVAYAAYFDTYSTFRALPSLYLEDLFVHPSVRGRGIGTALVRALAAAAVARGCARFEWTVLDWNVGAQGFYTALGARILNDWRLCRLDGEDLASFARPG